MDGLMYILLPIAIMSCCIICYGLGKVDGFKDGLKTAEKIYHTYIKEG